MKDTAWIACPLCDGDDAEALFTHEDFPHVKCRSCGLIYVNPRISRVEAYNAEIYGRKHPVWSKAYGKFMALDSGEREAFLERARHRPSRKYMRELQAFERYRRSGHFLDVGCADGRFLLAAQGAGWEVKGVEITPENASLCRNGFGLDVFCGTLDKAGIGEDLFDGVRMNQVIEHVDLPMHLLRHVARVMRPGGLLSLATVNIDSLTFNFLKSSWAYLGSAYNGHIVFFSKKTLNRALAETGFRPLKWITTGVRLRNPGTRSRSLGDRGAHVAEKVLGYFAGLAGKGGRIHVYAEKR